MPSLAERLFPSPAVGTPPARRTSRRRARSQASGDEDGASAAKVPRFRAAAEDVSTPASGSPGQLEEDSPTLAFASHGQLEPSSAPAARNPEDSSPASSSLEDVESLAVDSPVQLEEDKPTAAASLEQPADLPSPAVCRAGQFEDVPSPAAGSPGKFEDVPSPAAGSPAKCDDVPSPAAGEVKHLPATACDSPGPVEEVSVPGLHEPEDVPKAASGVPGGELHQASPADAADAVAMPVLSRPDSMNGLILEAVRPKRGENGSRVLDLGGLGLGDTGARAVADALGLLFSHGLDRLILSANEITDSGAASLAEALKAAASPCTLRFLNLRGNDIGTAGASALAKALRTLPHLESLDIGGNSFDEQGREALECALARLPRRRTRRHLKAVL
eukprot:gnl/TRDRNA2_/TRDRNA2_82344_c0_seq1.p1 gnl/TRDRNA2_/TRDRNA2_82344_c0~~gnl/TRDRNA2_/TRDRNA2_82344_c0_seq1.p1  ORF type:complete len:399 (-),score=91.79 gnl/TRDRNA2_/TRDRNA2_82344_c0_seq1:125-1291(-)